MNGLFGLMAWAMRALGWILWAFIALTLGCAAVYIVAWGIFWRAMGW